MRFYNHFCDILTYLKEKNYMSNKQVFFSPIDFPKESFIWIQIMAPFYTLPHFNAVMLKCSQVQRRQQLVLIFARLSFNLLSWMNQQTVNTENVLFNFFIHARILTTESDL